MTDITVQVIEKDGYIKFCNHAGATSELVTVGSDDSEYRMVCDKCGAQLIDDEWVGGDEWKLELMESVED